MRYHEAVIGRLSDQPERVFIIEDAKRPGFHWGVTERAGLTRLRFVPVAARVWICCLGRVETGNVIRGEKQTKLQFDCRVEQELAREIAVPTPKRWTGGDRRNSAPMDDVPPPTDEDAPF